MNRFFCFSFTHYMFQYSKKRNLLQRFGAFEPVDGNKPELGNLTLSMTILSPAILCFSHQTVFPIILIRYMEKKNMFFAFRVFSRFGVEGSLKKKRKKVGPLYRTGVSKELYLNVKPDVSFHLTPCSRKIARSWKRDENGISSPYVIRCSCIFECWLFIYLFPIYIRPTCTTGRSMNFTYSYSYAYIRQAASARPLFSSPLYVNSLSLFSSTRTNGNLNQIHKIKFAWY